MTDEIKGAEENNLQGEAPVIPEATPIEPEATPAPDDAAIAEGKVQTRINTITRQKHTEGRRADAEKSRADAAEQRLSELEGRTIPVGIPKLEDSDWDEETHQAKMVEYQVAKALEAQGQQTEANRIVQEGKTLADNFAVKATEFAIKNPEYQETVNGLPIFHDDTANAIYSMDNGPEIALYLGKHLDVADQIANLSPVQAAARLGQISQKLITINKTVDTTNAPAPVETIGGGGSVNKSANDMSMDEIYKQP